MKKTWGSKPRPSALSRLSGRLFLGALLALPGGVVVTFLWNAILPAAVPGVQPLGFLQGLGLLILARVLFYSGTGAASEAPRRSSKAAKALPEEDRAAFLARIRQRLAEADHDEKPKFSN
jgi:hypothetical protein